MKKKVFISVTSLLIMAALLFAACAKNDDGCCNPVPGSQAGDVTEAPSKDSDAAVDQTVGNADNPAGESVSNQTSALSPAFSSGEGTQNGGILSRFQTVDINNNQVDQSVFQGKKLTMVNIWATFCGPCIREMPDLGEISVEYADKGFQIIGIPVDVLDRKGNLDSAMVATAKEIVDKTGANYLHLLPSESLIRAKLGEVSSVPETIFVDENGKQVGKSYLGSLSKAKWEMIINDLLEQVK